MGTNQRGSQSSDGITKWTKEKGNKGHLEVAWNKELKWGGRQKADLYGTGPEGDVTRATRIGNHVEIGNCLGINWEWRQLLDCEGRGYTETERRQDRRDSNWRS